MIPRVLWGAVGLASLILSVPSFADVGNSDPGALNEAFPASHPNYSLPDNPKPDLPQLIAGLETQSTLKPDDAETWHQLGLAYQENHEFDKAVEALKKAVALPGASSGMWIDLGINLDRQLDSNGATDAFRQATTVNPSSIVTWVTLASQLLNHGDYDGCRDTLAKAQSLHPSSPEIWNTMGLLDVTQGANAQAVLDFQKASTQDPNYAFAPLNLGVFLTRHEKYDDALEPLIQGINLQPNNPVGWQFLTMNYVNRKVVPEGLAKFQELLKAHPDSAPGWMDLGVLQDGTGNIDPVPSLEKAVQLDPKLEQGWDYLGTVYWKTKRLPDAEKAFQESVKISPQSPDAWGNLGYIQLSQNEADAAIASLEKALKIKSDYVRAIALLALAFDQKGNKDMAKAECERLDHLDPATAKDVRSKIQ